jgi:hypothetical protein
MRESRGSRANDSKRFKVAFLTESKHIYSCDQDLCVDCGLIPSLRIVLIVLLTVIVIVIVVVARVLTGRPWSNLSSPKPDS